MGIASVLEPVTVILLLTVGSYLNRRPSPAASIKDLEAGQARQTSPRIHPRWELSETPSWRIRTIGIFGWRKRVQTPNTALFKTRKISRILDRFPFIVEVIYWGLIYWIYQLGRAFTAIRLPSTYVSTARAHAFQLISLEKRLHIFWELQIQRAVLFHPGLVHVANWIYSYIHIPATILFLVCLYYHTITIPLRNAITAFPRHSRSPSPTTSGSSPHRHRNGPLTGSALYAHRRRTMAASNIIAFVIFSTWPLMPPRLLSDPATPGKEGDLARSFGFVDTVHQGKGAGGSVWTSNRFCNQWAAMPSLHFGYSVLIGLSIALLPLSSTQYPTTSSPPLSPAAKPTNHLQILSRLPVSTFNLPSFTRIMLILLGLSYPLLIAFVVLATANHFILDVVAGAAVCALGWAGNGVLLNLLVVEDWVLWCLGVAKPEVR